VRKKIQGSKPLFPLPLCVQGKQENNVVQNGIVLVFFLRKNNEFGNNPKRGYDNCPLFTMLTEQRPCVVRVVKINKTKILKMIFSKLG